MLAPALAAKRVSDCTSKPVVKGPTKFIVALFLKVASLALSNVPILEPPTRNFYLLYELKLVSFCTGLIEVTVKFPFNITLEFGPLFPSVASK